MRLLIIDTSNKDKVEVTLETEDGEFKKELNQTLGSQALLGLITKVLREKNFRLEDLEEIKVNKGPGSFTGLRVGVSVANALGYSLKIPVNGRDLETEINY